MKQDRSEALEIAVYAGIILLQSGAEIFRVDETVERITISIKPNKQKPKQP